MIEVEKLTKKYGSFVAVDSLTFSVEKGEILGFLGLNAAGKTTTMRMLTGYFPPTDGTAKVGEYDVFTDSIKVRKIVGYMPERIPLYFNMTVEGYLDFVADIKKVDIADKSRRLDYVYERCGLADVRHKLISKLSKGYRQRVGLAQAIIHDPQVLILDEPTSGLDPKQIKDVRDLIKNFRGERTIILSTHILPEVSQVCSKVVIINQGKLVAIDTPENLSDRFDKMRGYREISLKVREKNKSEVMGVLNKVNGVNKIEVQSEDDNLIHYRILTEVKDKILEEISSAIVSREWGLLEIAPVHMSLEDVFLKLTDEEVHTEDKKEEAHTDEKKKEGEEK